MLFPHPDGQNLICQLVTGTSGFLGRSESGLCFCVKLAATDTEVGI